MLYLQIQIQVGVGGGGWGRTNKLLNHANNKPITARLETLPKISHQLPSPIALHRRRMRTPPPTFHPCEALATPALRAQAEPILATGQHRGERRRRREAYSRKRTATAVATGLAISTIQVDGATNRVADGTGCVSHKGTTRHGLTVVVTPLRCAAKPVMTGEGGRGEIPSQCARRSWRMTHDMTNTHTRTSGSLTLHGIGSPISARNKCTYTHTHTCTGR